MYKLQSVSASCLATIKQIGGSLVVSHGVISYVRRTFTSKCSLPGVPHLFQQIFMLIRPLPRQGIKLIQSIEIQRADPLTRKPRNALFRKPSLTVLPLLLDPWPVFSPIEVLQPPGFFRVLMQKETSKQRIIWETHGLFGPDSVEDFCPDWFDFIPDMPRLKSPAFSLHEDISRHLIGYNLLGLLQRPHIDARSHLF